MATIDISREAFDPRKHYSSVRMQQGRVIVDDDWNENERIENEDRRRARVDIIGRSGSPDQGFRIPDARIADGMIDFDVLPGTFYLGGLRLDLENKETYRTQKDWLQQSGNLHEAPKSERFDLVYLVAWQQPVGAVEDSELFEVALGGPDTSMRLRNMRRVKLWGDVQTTDCAVAWQKLIDELEAMNNGEISDENEFIPDIRLTVSFSKEGVSEDLCKPSVLGGYLGAENQAIRVQLVDKEHFTWGFDNASPLYRVEVNESGDIVTLLTDPKDQAHWPLSGQVVEILPWSAVLSNREKVSGMSGHLSLVNKSYDPDSQELTLTVPLPSGFGEEWKSRSDSDELKEPSEYLFMRVWNRGSDRSSDPAISFTTGIAVPLGNTGLQVTINGNDCVPGHYWIIAARPETPDRVVPWELEKALPPHGVRRFYAPLALIHWKANSAREMEGEVIRDCRRRFRPLTEQGTCCCTYYVGNGGDFDSIQEAVDHLHSSGGVICVLPGEYRENVLIEGRSSITIKACGGNTLIMPEAGHKEAPIFHVKDSQRITLEDMDISTLDGTAILLEGSEQGKLKEVEIRNNRILAYENGIRVNRGIGINIHHNRISMSDKEDAGVGILIMAEDSIIERNYISAVPATVEIPPEVGIVDYDPIDPCLDPEVMYEDVFFFQRYMNWLWSYTRFDIFVYAYTEYNALGGIQITGGSSGIKVLENEIIGGAGNGITLGGEIPSSTPVGASRVSAVSEVPGFAAPGPSGIPYGSWSDSKWTYGEVVTENGDPVGDVVVSFVKKLGTETITDVSGKSGELWYLMKEDVPDAETLLETYTLRVSTPDVEARNARAEDDRVIVTVVRTDPPSIPALIREIQIDHNEISNMGLSGIGIPHVQPLPQLVKSVGFFAELGNPVINLSINRNHIFNCLRNPFHQIKEYAIRRGLGGISLGLCWYLYIHENRIENNGINHIRPVCGLYVAYGEHIDIVHNHIINNGPLVSSSAALEQGKRGGIFLALVSSTPVFEQNASRDSSAAKDRLAARIHDNIVDQPAGKSLVISASGTISVLGNQFNSELSEVDSLEGMAGGVFIFNLGGMQQDTQKNAAWVSRPSSILPKGNILFNSNQSRVGSANASSFSQVIYSLDDIGFDGNQSDNLKNGKLISNTLLYGRTIRATDNRFKEVIQANVAEELGVSLFTVTQLMNNTSNNQGDHCIIPINLWNMPVVDLGNQTLANSERCMALADTLNKSLKGTDLETYLNELRRVQNRVLNDLKEIQVITRSFLQYEEIWRTKEFGEDHPRTVEMADSIKYNSDSIALHKAVLVTAAGILKPIVSDMMPSGNIADARPIIAANVGNVSAAREVILKVDGSPVTTQVGDYASITYTPEEDLADGKHTVELEVVDIAGESIVNLWDFQIIQPGGPIITDMTPKGDGINDATPTISAKYSDTNIDLGSVTLTLNGIVIADAQVGEDMVSYTPKEPLKSGITYNVRVTVKNQAGVPGEAEWVFSLEEDPPSISNEKPTGTVAPGNVEISAIYSDDGTGIDESTATMELYDPAGSEIPVDEVPSAAGIKCTAALVEPGRYTIRVEVSDKAGNIGSREWTFTVGEDDAPVMKLSTENLDFGTAKTKETFTISNAGGGVLEWQASVQESPWIKKLSPNNGSLASGAEVTITVEISREGQDQGEHNSSISINSNGGIGEVKISMTVPSPSILLTPPSLDFGMEDTVIAEKVFVITNPGGSDMRWQIISKQTNWIMNVDPKGGLSLQPGASANVAVQICRRGLSSGQYQHEMLIRYNDENDNVLTVPFTVTMGVPG